MKERSTAETLTASMAQIAALHCLGVLVIDEIQNLNLSRTGGEERTLNFSPNWLMYWVFLLSLLVREELPIYLRACLPKQEEQQVWEIWCLTV